MGCGSSVTENQHLKVVPTPLPQPNISAATVEPAKQSKVEATPNRTGTKPNSGNQNSALAAKKEPGSKSPDRKALEKDLRSSSTNKKQNTKSSSNVKLTDSTTVPRNEPSPAKPKDELRESSTSKSQKNAKGKEDLRSSKSKLTNPELEGELRESHSVSIIKEEESELRNTKTKKEMTHSIKKIKSVKNNKDLADLIKIYAL